MQENRNTGVYFENFWGKKFTIIAAIGIIIAVVGYIIALPYMPEDAEMNATHPYFEHLKEEQTETPSAQPE